MQFPESWLRSLVDPPFDTEQLCHLLTMAGLEVEQTRPVALAFSGVVVARVLSTEKHPDADRLSLCQVDAGDYGVLRIVCGAPNVAAGMTVPCALVGARLPGLEIRQAKVRGIDSSGMLCSARELGLAEQADGLMMLPAELGPGEDLRQALMLDDTLIELKLTPNRADCLSLLGIAREVAALTGVSLRMPDIESVDAACADALAIRLDAPEACPRYCGRIVRGVNARAATPDWMVRRLERCGLRSISVLVDITNYVMLELGQPLHAFDLARIDGPISVRRPQPGETLTLLTGQIVTPEPDMVLIADGRQALALAGIMGGAYSGIGETTTDLFLESAFFAPQAIAGKARALGLATDAAHRFERGVDFDLPRRAIERATRLIVDLCGGTAGPVTEAVSEEHLPRRMPIRLRQARLKALLGVDLAHETVARLLAALGGECRADGADFVVTPPSWRFDLAIEEDLIEEVARLYGYDAIPAPAPRAPLRMLPLPQTTRSLSALKRAVAARDYFEIIGFSFVDAAWEADFAGNGQPIRLANPIASPMSVMRSTLIGSLVHTLATNRKRQIERVRIFEVGRCFSRDVHAGETAGFRQTLRLAGLAAGAVHGEQWGLPARRVDFFDVKGDIEAVLSPEALRCARVEHPALHPGRAASLWLGERQIGVLGELHPRLAQTYELGPSPVVFELDLDILLDRRLPLGRELSRFPAVRRDIALVVAEDLAYDRLLAALRSAAPPCVTEIALFDVYTGAGLPAGRKSLAFRIVMQDIERTLEDAEIEAAIAALVAAATECGARLRT